MLISKERKILCNPLFFRLLGFALKNKIYIYIDTHMSDSLQKNIKKWSRVRSVQFKLSPEIFNSIHCPIFV